MVCIASVFAYGRDYEETYRQKMEYMDTPRLLLQPWYRPVHGPGPLVSPRIPSHLPINSITFPFPGTPYHILDFLLESAFFDEMRDSG